MAYSRIRCPKCDCDFGQESKFVKHLVNDHLITDVELFYVDTNDLGSKQVCGCGCNKPVKWNGWKKGYTSKYLRGHNAVIDSVYNDPNKQKEWAKKRKEGFAQGKYKVWNDGLTKETSESIKSSSEKSTKTLREGYANGTYKPWQTGLTKETSDSVKKISETRKDLLKQGKIKIWSTGLTKETDERLMSVSLAVSDAYKNREMGNRLSSTDVLDRISKYAGFELLTDIEDYTTRRVTRLMFKCTKCSRTQSKSLAMLEETPVCFHCHPKESLGQLEIFDFVANHAPDARSSDRTVISPQELDIYIPSKTLGIEYNGLYWHSEKFKSESYHQYKLDLCNKQGVSLFMIYEDEWRDKRRIVESMILHRLGINVKKMGARSLSIKTVSSGDARMFFDSSHLEGYARSKVTFGLYDSDTLISAMSLRVPFHKKYKGMLEVARSACLPGYNVHGWLGKLTSEAKRYCASNGYKSIMTYVDSRVGSGSGYRSAGWIPDGKTGAPRFWWTDSVNKWNRFKFKADKERGMTQQQVAAETGVNKIFGCNNSRWFVEVNS